MSEDFYLPRLLARWNPKRGVWETGQVDLLSGLSELYSVTFPSSGTTRNGLVFEQPTPALPTDGSGSSSLPTPRASRGASGTETMYALGATRSDENRTQGEVLLPTPHTSSGTGPGDHGTGGPNLQTAVHLLPTPQVADATGGHKTRSGERSNEMLLPGGHGIAHASSNAGCARFGQYAGESSSKETGTRSGDFADGSGGSRPDQNWGPYRPAIERWEAVTGRTAPRPTEPTGRDGAERLSARLTEWMMGWPDGWVTDPAIGLTRNEQLKACGNGVVPQQAILALQVFMNRLEVAV